MTQPTWTLPVPTSQQGAEHLVRAVRYAEPELESADISLDGENFQITLPELVLDDTRTAAIQVTLERIWRQSNEITDSETQQVWSTEPVSTAPHVSERFTTDTGAAILKDEQVLLLDLLDQWVLSVYETLGQLSARSYGPVMPPSVLERSGYLKNHPNLLMFATRPVSSVTNYDLLSSTPSSEIDEVALTKPFAAFIPAQCLPTYEEFRKDAGHDLQNQLITSIGPVSRYEMPYEDGMRRLTFYKVRELLILGDADYVLDVRERAMTAFREAMTLLGVEAHCDAAQDAFFASDLSADRLESQATMAAKFELNMPSSNGIDVAVASFNFAGESLTRPFELNARRKDLVSGCVGVGLERLAFCLVHQLGSTRNVTQRITEQLGAS